MATVIHVTCRACGDVALRPADLVLQIAAHDLDHPAYAEFRCPLCGALWGRQVEGALVAHLVACDGVRLELHCGS